MVEAFSARTHYQPGGLPLEEWMALYIDQNQRVGDGLITVKTADNQLKEVPIANAAVAFHTLKELRRENHGPRGGAPAIGATPYEHAILLKQGFQAWGSRIQHQYATKCEVVIPLSLSANAADDVVLQQSARVWVSNGGNDIEPNIQHVANMLMSALQSLLFTICFDLSQRKQTKLMELMVHLIRASKAFFARHADAFKLVAALLHADNARDSMQRALAFVFCDQTGLLVREEEGKDLYHSLIDQETLLRMIEMMLKRYVTHHPNAQNESIPDFFEHPIHGIVGTLLIVPLLMRMIRGHMTAAEAIQIMNNKSMAMLQFVLAHTTESVKTISIPKRNLLYMQQLIRQSGCFAHDFSIDRLFFFCMNRSNNRIPFAFTAVESHVLFPVVTEGICNRGKPTKATVRVRARPFDGPLFPEKKSEQEVRKTNSCMISSSNPLEWAGFGLSLAGIYTIDTKLIANATAGVGPTLNASNAAVVRFSLGRDVLSTKQEGKSSAGMLYRDEHMYQQWTDTKCALDLSKPFTVWVTAEHMRVFQTGLKTPDGLFYSIKRGSDPTRPCLIGFKFVDLIVSYQPLPLQQDQPGAAVAAASASEAVHPPPLRKGELVIDGIDASDLTAGAIMAKLKLLGLAPV